MNAPEMLKTQPNPMHQWLHSGPSCEDYPRLMDFAVQLVKGESSSMFQPIPGNLLSRIHSDLFDGVLSNTDTCLGFCYSKPHGYAGDFEIIDRIYTRYMGSTPAAQNWDRFFHEQKAVKAVRNRKDYFKRALRAFLEEHQGPVRILNLASGPGRDLAEFLQENKDLATRIQVDCVELDKKAIRHARTLVGPRRNVNFIQANVFRFRSKEKYDFIWSAGLFDYFDDRTFERILSRFYDNVREGGQMVIGNFHPCNPTLPLMVLQDWILNYRTGQQLEFLAKNATQGRAKLWIERESEGVNLFLRIAK